jgi:hypothetical protein
MTPETGGLGKQPHERDTRVPGLTRLRVAARFALRGVWVRPEALGSTFVWTKRDHTITLILPREQADFARDDEPEVPAVAAWMPTPRIEATGEALAVHLISVDVSFSGPLSAADKAAAIAQRDNGDEALIERFADEAEALWRGPHTMAEEAAHAWLAQVRVTSGQPWLGVAVEPPMQYGRSRIIDDDAGKDLMAFGPTQSVTFRSGELALTTAQLNEIRDQVASQGEPSVAESLLADARFLAQEAEVVDAQRAVLIAAIACEIKVKLVLRQKAGSSRMDLLKLVLRRTSNLEDLLGELAMAALGVSLRKKDQPLYGHMKRLNELRNQVVHRGANVEQQEGWQLVVAAGLLFQWLDALPVVETEGDSHRSGREESSA